MIFFSIPSVGQIKPDTTFGRDDHFGFIQTQIGAKYHRNEIALKCKEYYSKPTLKYWDQIITLMNFMGLKKLDESNKFTTIPLVNFIADQYDQDSQLPSQILFDYLLCKWQYPHPINTHNKSTKDKNLDLIIKNQRTDYPLVKPYAVILSILKDLHNIDPKYSYLKNDEFYWLGYTFYKEQGKYFTLSRTKEIANNIISMREKGGWDKYEKLRGIDSTTTHLSYPKGFLKNSSVLTDESIFYDSIDDFFIGLKTISYIIPEVESLIKSTEGFFEFDRAINEKNNELGFRYSEYLYDPKHINKWLHDVDIYKDQINIFNPVKADKGKFDAALYEKYKVNTQLKRLAVLDKETVTRRRTEQYILRNYLLKNKTSGSCALCNKNYPINFLATAHIKKRSNCSDNEKRDLNIVMPACYLGCDKLYEAGYIYVKDGEVKENLTTKNITEDLSAYIDNIKNKKCDYYKKETIKYFKYHETQASNKKNEI